MKTLSPLRYPGGKASLAKYLQNLIETNLSECSYFELYAGGAGAALELLYNESVKRIILNDADPHIYAFWVSVLKHTEEFCRKVMDTDVSMDSWHRERSIYLSDDEMFSPVEVGFSTFFLNRCNRSGIIKKAGPIGGMEQSGTYKIDCRFNKKDLIKRIERIAQYESRIEIYNEDTIAFIENSNVRLADEHAFTYLDPPYYKKGKSLYLNAYSHDDHVRLRNLLAENRNLKWMVSYDNVPEIISLYEGFRTVEHELSYTLQNKRKTKELFVFSDSITII